MIPVDVLLAAGAVARLTRLIVTDRITEGWRIWLWRRFPADDTLFTADEVTGSKEKGWKLHSGVEVVKADATYWAAVRPRLLGELISCGWCVAMWVALVWTPLYLVWPGGWRAVSAFLTVAYLAGWLATRD